MHKCHESENPIIFVGETKFGPLRELWGWVTGTPPPAIPGHKVAPDASMAQKGTYQVYYPLLLKVLSELSG